MFVPSFGEIQPGAQVFLCPPSPPTNPHLSSKHTMLDHAGRRAILRSYREILRATQSLPIESERLEAYRDARERMRNPALPTSHDPSSTHSDVVPTTLTDILRTMEIHTTFLRQRSNAGPSSNGSSTSTSTSTSTSSGALSSKPRGGIFVIRKGKAIQRDPADRQGRGSSAPIPTVDMAGDIERHRRLIRRQHFGRDPGPNWRPGQI